MRALYGEISGRSLGGGGTITMQVVRNYVLSFERTYERKLKEIFLAWRLEDYLNKEQIPFISELPYLRFPGFEKIKNNDIVVFNWPVDTLSLIHI